MIRKQVYVHAFSEPEKVETTRMSDNGQWISKLYQIQTVDYSPATKKERSTDTSHSVKEPLRFHVPRKKRDTEGSYRTIPFIGNLPRSPTLGERRQIDLGERGREGNRFLG